MKKIFAMILALLMLLSFAACGKKTESDDNRIIGQASEEYTYDYLPSDDPIYDEMGNMFPSVFKFVEYNHILGNSIDYRSVEKEDFWNIVAITLDAYKDVESIASIDIAGTYHVKWIDMVDIAKTFMIESWVRHSVPSYNGSYSASADPGSGVIDLIPLSVDNYTSTLLGIERAGENSKYDYIMHVTLEGGEDDNSTHHYVVYLAEWGDYLKENYDLTDEGNHIMPYIVANYHYLYSTEQLQKDTAQ